jgi:hypothetical protein
MTMTIGMGGHSPSEVLHDLKGIDFPANRSDLVNQAQENNASEDVLNVLSRMPDRQYNNMADIMKGYGQIE